MLQPAPRHYLPPEIEAYWLIQDLKDEGSSVFNAQDQAFSGSDWPWSIDRIIGIVNRLSQSPQPSARPRLEELKKTLALAVAREVRVVDQTARGVLAQLWRAVAQSTNQQGSLASGRTQAAGRLEENAPSSRSAGRNVDERRLAESESLSHPPSLRVTEDASPTEQVPPAQDPAPGVPPAAVPGSPRRFSLLAALVSGVARLWTWLTSWLPI